MGAGTLKTLPRQAGKKLDKRGFQGVAHSKISRFEGVGDFRMKNLGVAYSVERAKTKTQIVIFGTASRDGGSSRKYL